MAAKAARTFAPTSAATKVAALREHAFAMPGFLAWIALYRAAAVATEAATNLAHASATQVGVAKIAQSALSVRSQTAPAMALARMGGACARPAFPELHVR